MEVVCNKCGYVINRDKYINGQLIEEYKNIYGTHCSNCKKIVEPLKKYSLNSEKELDIEILRNEMREKLKKKIQGEKKCQ